MTVEDNKIEVVSQQDAVFVEAGEGAVAISQDDSWPGGQSNRIVVSGKGNVDALIAALQHAREGMA